MCKLYSRMHHTSIAENSYDCSSHRNRNLLKILSFFLLIFVCTLISWFLRVNFIVDSVILQCQRFGEHVKSFTLVRAISSRLQVI